MIGHLRRNNRMEWRAGFCVCFTEDLSWQFVVTTCYIAAYLEFLGPKGNLATLGSPTGLLKLHTKIL